MMGLENMLFTTFAPVLSNPHSTFHHFVPTDGTATLN